MAEIAWPETILLVDDSVVARLGVKNVLADLGSTATIVEANSAAAGLEVFVDSQPGVAIIDFNMPGEDGLSLCAQLREEAPDALLILCTANVQRAVADRALALKVPMVNKPVSASKLEPLIQKLCRG